jgi:hypothetical protein
MRLWLLSCFIFTPWVVAADFHAFLETHCLECHDREVKKGGLDLSGFTDEAAVMQDREVWRAVFEKVESRQMPPPKQKDQPTDAQRKELLACIMDIAARPDAVLGAADPGRPALRRLTRLEYNNSVRDLFALDVDVLMLPERLPISDKSYFQPASGSLPATVRVPLREYGQKYPVLCRNHGLPGDSRAEHGYRNRGDAMDFSPLLLEKYLAAAQDIVNAPELVSRSQIAARLFGVSMLPRVAAAQKGTLSFTASSEMARDARAWKNAEGSADHLPQRFFEDVRAGFTQSISGVFDAGDATGGVTVLPGKGGVLRVTYAGGEKRLTINPNADLWLAGFATVTPTSGSRILANHTKGEKTYELTLGIENGDEDEGVMRLGVFVLGRKEQSGQVTLTARFTDDTESRVSAMIPEGAAGTTFFSFAAVPGESVKSLFVDGSQFSGEYLVLDDLGFITSGEPKHTAVPAPLPVVKNPPEPKKLPASKRLSDFMEQAFRRSVPQEEAAHFIALYEDERRNGKTEHEAMKTAIAAILASPSFLYIEANGTPGDAKVSLLEDHELATRLAAFLWCSIPDAELLALAKANQLHDPAVLEAQTRRMLKDPRSRELGESFAMQWLRLDQISTSKPDPDLFKAFYAGPQGKSTLHGAVLTEALLLFETVHVEDRSVLDFIAADFTWLNAALARLYGIPMNDEVPAVVTSDPTREVKKKDDGGQWHRVRLVDANRGGFIGMAAPMVITSLPFRTSPVKRGAWMLETLFNRPPTEPKIAFAFEDDSKDAAQKMSIRERFEAHRNKAACYSCHIRLDPPGFALERFDPIGVWNDKADAKAEWNDQPFDGPAGFKALLSANPHEFTRGFIEHMLSYALGRELHIYDMPVIEKIEQASKTDGWRLSRIVVEIVKSYPFNHVRL